jgi:hypothetical protein
MLGFNMEHSATQQPPEVQQGEARHLDTRQVEVQGCLIPKHKQEEAVCLTQWEEAAKMEGLPISNRLSNTKRLNLAARCLKSAQKLPPSAFQRTNW